MSGKKKNNPITLGVLNAVDDPFTPIGSRNANINEVWSWGGDNLFPYGLALLARRSTAHRRIINDKADYISGKGITCDEKELRLQKIIERANGNGDTLRSVINKLAFDKCLFGNAFLEIVTDSKRSFVSFFHQDASRCRLSKDKKNIILHHDWTAFTKTKAKSLSLWPAFTKAVDGTLRSIVHYKDYEPMFENYGVPAYIAGLNVSAIAYKTDKWNISRLDNSFQFSGVMLIDGNCDTEQEAQELVRTAEKKFGGKPGQVLFMLKDLDGSEGTKFIPIQSSNEGDWKALHDQANTDIVVAHSWFRSLSGLDYATGFSPERVLHEYEVAKNTVILPEQEEIMEPVKQAIELIAGIDTESMQIINRPPLQEKPAYLRIWEARKMDGLDYDENDSAQQEFLASLNRTKNAVDYK